MVDPRDDTAGTAPGPPAGRPGDATSGDAGGAEDAAWVEAARSGDDLAFGRLFDRWFDPVYDVAWRIVRNRDTAAEVAQDVFLAAWQGLDGLEQPASFGGWVRRIARNRALNRLDRERRSVPDDEQAAAVLDRSAPDVDLTAALSEREQHDLVWAAARALGERDASLLDLHLRHGLGAGAMADELGVTANNAHQLLHRLKDKLAGAIQAWVLWRAGEGRCPGLDRVIAGAGLASFGPEAVRVIDRHARNCDGCAERQQLRLAPEALFAAMPIVAAPPLLRTEAAAALGQAGVPMTGSAAAPGGADAGGAGGEGAGVEAGGAGGPGSAAAEGPGAGSEKTVPRAALVAASAVVALLIAGLAGLAISSDGGTTETANTAGSSSSTVATAPPTAPGTPGSGSGSGSGSAKSGPRSAPAKPAPAPPVDDDTVTTTVPRGSGRPPGTTASTDDPAPPPPGEPPPSTPDADPPTIGGFRATVGEPCGATRLDRLVQLAWQSVGGESATVSGPGGTSTHEASGATSRCLPVPTEDFTLTVTGPGGTATRTTSAG